MLLVRRAGAPHSPEAELRATGASAASASASSCPESSVFRLFPSTLFHLQPRACHDPTTLLLPCTGRWGQCPAVSSNLIVLPPSDGCCDSTPRRCSSQASQGAPDRLPRQRTSGTFWARSGSGRRLPGPQCPPPPHTLCLGSPRGPSSRAQKCRPARLQQTAGGGSSSSRYCVIHSCPAVAGTNGSPCSSCLTVKALSARTIWTARHAKSSCHHCHRHCPAPRPPCRLPHAHLC